MEIVVIVMAAVLGYFARRLRHDAFLFPVWAIVLIAVSGETVQLSGGRVSLLEIGTGSIFAAVGIMEYVSVLLERKKEEKKKMRMNSTT